MLKHVFVSDKADKADITRLRPSDWNKEHNFTGGARGYQLIRDTTQQYGGSFQQKLQLDVRDGGALGNGVHDDTDNILATYTELCARGGGILAFGPGTFICNTPTSVGGTSIILPIPTGNVTFKGSGPSTKLIGGTAPQSAGGFFGLGTVAPMTYESGPVTYAIDPAILGDWSVTATTAAHAANFAVGDVIFLIGSGSLGSREQSIVRSVNASTGVIGLLYPLSKAFATGTIANVTSITTKHIKIEDMWIESPYQSIIGAQIFDLSIKNVIFTQPAGSTLNHTQLNYIRGLEISKNHFSWSETPATNGIDPGRSCMDVWIEDNTIISDVAAVGATEGAAHWQILNNHIYTRSASGAIPISMGGAYDILFQGNKVYCSISGASTPALYDSNGALSSDIVIDNNEFHITGSGNYVIKAESTGTKITNNKIRTTLSGIWGVGANQGILGNEINLITTADINGIVLESTVQSQRVNNNTIIKEGTRSTGSGILVVSNSLTKSPSIVGNKIDNFVYGIKVLSPADHPKIIVSANAITNCTNDYTPTYLSGCLGLVLATYANNAAAVTAGLPLGALYRNNADPDVVCTVHA